MKILDNLKIKIFADGADQNSIKKLNEKKYIKGFTTNPSLMRKAGIKDYKSFAKEILREINDKPISFEVFSDEIQEMKKQAEEIATWGSNVNVKIPITNTKKHSTAELIKSLSSKGIICNITALFTDKQIEEVYDAIDKSTPAILSIFAGRIADTGVDPSDIISKAVKLASSRPNIEILWASTREAYNYIQAKQLKCNIITMPPKVINQINTFGKSYKAMTLDTVKGFLSDSKKSKFSL